MADLIEGSIVIEPDAVYIDPVLGVPLLSAYLTTLVGTPGLPVNNLTDALSICASRNTKKIHIKRQLTMDQDLSIDYCFVGDNDWAYSGIILNNYDVAGSTFDGLSVIGSSPGLFTAVNCYVTGSTTTPTIPSIIAADLRYCYIGSIQPIPGPSGLITCLNCISQGPPRFISLADGAMLGWAGGSGSIFVKNADNAASLLTLVSVLGGLTIDSSCVDGLIQIGQAYWVWDNSLGTLVINHANYAQGKINTKTIHITDNADSGLVAISASFLGAVQINSMVLRSNGATTADLTTAGIYCEDGAVVNPISPAVATQAALNAAGKQVSNTGPWGLRAYNYIYIDLVGTGPTPVDLYLDITYQPLDECAYLL